MPSATSKLDILITAKDNASGAIGNVENSLKGLDKSAGTLADGLGGLLAGAGIAGIGALVAGIGGAAVDMAKTAAETERLGTAFDQLAGKAGQSGDAILAAMQQAARGTVSNADLMASANRAMLLGVADSAGEMAQLMDVASARGKAMGESTSQAFSDLVTGIGRMSPMILDNLGITIDAQKAYDDYARQLGVTSQSLDDAGKKQAILNAVIQSSTDLVKDNKDAGDDAASNYERMDAALTNAKDSLGSLFGPAVAVVAQKIADAATSAAQALEQVGQKSNLGQITQEALAAQASLGGLEDTLRTQTALLADMKANGEEGTLAYQNLAQAGADTQKQLNAANATLNASGVAAKNAATSSYDLWIAEQNANVATQEAAIASRAAASARGDEAVRTGMLTDKIHELQAASLAARSALAGIESSAVGALQSAAQRAVPVLGADTVSKMYTERATKLKEQIDLLTKYGYTTDQATFKATEMAAAAAKPFNDAVDAEKDAEKASKAYGKSMKDAASEAQQAFDSLQGKVAGVLSQALNTGTGVDPQKALEKMGFPREDAINENARRLADIAANGLKNQDWLGAFQSEVPDIWKMIRLAQNPQEEAARLLQDFQDGLLTSPIDKDKAKEIVKRQIMGEQNMADLAKEIATELSQEMGVPLQQAMSAASGALGVGGGGTGAGQTFADGFQQQTQDSDVGGSVVSTVDTQLRAKYPLLVAAGKEAAKQWGDAFIAVVGDKVPSALIDILTTLITPQVIARFSQQQTQTGATP
jgi:hypothetical protein